MRGGMNRISPSVGSEFYFPSTAKQKQPPVQGLALWFSVFSRSHFSNSFRPLLLTPGCFYEYILKYLLQPFLFLSRGIDQIYLVQHYQKQKSLQIPPVSKIIRSEGSSRLLAPSSLCQSLQSFNHNNSDNLHIKHKSYIMVPDQWVRKCELTPGFQEPY